MTTKPPTSAVRRQRTLFADSSGDSGGQGHRQPSNPSGIRFLRSENADFCRSCAGNDLVFIGPPVSAIESMGSKSAAKQIMERAGVPLLPGYHGSDHDEAQLKQAADAMGYPVPLRRWLGAVARVCAKYPTLLEFDDALAAAKRHCPVLVTTTCWLKSTWSRRTR